MGMASTTNFGFGSTTACGCSNPDTLVKNLAELGWYGAASTVWQGSPYKGTGDSWSCGACEGGTCNDAISNNWGSQSFNNCASGSSGCMTCWELTVADEPNIYGAKLAAAGKKANVVVADNCEMNNQYGNNQQWCVPFKNVPSEGCVITGTCQPTSCQSGETLDEEAGSWSDDGAWNFGACGFSTPQDAPPILIWPWMFCLPPRGHGTRATIQLSQHRQSRAPPRCSMNSKEHAAMPSVATAEHSFYMIISACEQIMQQPVTACR